MARFLYRIVKTNPPTEEDFTSNFERGLPGSGSELHNPDIHKGISVFGDLEDALRRRELRPERFGNYLAEIEWPEDDPLVVMLRPPRNPRSSHRTLLGEPRAFLRLVRRVLECEPASA